jgi:Tfp pilus assembly protein PilO
MAMELGIDKQQIENAQAFLRNVSKDRIMLRFFVCGLILLVGWLTVLGPRADALADADKYLEKSKKQAKRGTDVVFFTNQLEAYEPHLFTDVDPTTLNRYVLDKLKLSGATLKTIAPKKTEARGPFKVIELDLDATGSYTQLVQLVDLLEHGEKVVRLEKVRFQRTKTLIIMELTVNGLVKPGLAAADGEAADEPAGPAGEAVPP